MPNQPQIIRPEPNTPTIVYKPSELLGIIASYFSQQDVSKQVIFLQGIYWKNPKNNPAWAYRYDVLRDENTQSEITLQIPHRLAEDLNAANDHARNVEQQLSELKSKGSGNKIGVIIAAVIAAVVITAIITTIICINLF